MSCPTRRDGFWRSNQRWLVLIGLLALVVRLVLICGAPSGEPGDLAGWEDAARRVTFDGIQAAYASLDPGSLYPPAFFYPLWLSGQLYRACCSADFVTGTAQSDVLMRLGPSIVDAFIATLVFALARSLEGATPVGARWAGLAYAFSPAVLITVAQRGMVGDPYLSALVLVAGLACLHGRTSLGAGCLMLAVLIKPQALALAPLIALLILRGGSIRAAARAVAACAVVILAVLVPFMLHGTLPTVWAATDAIAGLHAYTQNSADNVWTLLPVWRAAGAAPGQFGEVPDATTLVGGLSYRIIGLLALAALQALILPGVLRRPTTRHVTLAAATLAVGFFFLATRMHVNYVFLAFPYLCALVAINSPSLRLLMLGVTIACVVDWQDELPWAVHRFNAGLYAAAFAGLLMMHVWQPAIAELRERLPGRAGGQVERNARNRRQHVEV